MDQSLLEGGRDDVYKGYDDNILIVEDKISAIYLKIPIFTLAVIVTRLHFDNFHN